MPLVNSDINLVLTWPENCVISSTTRETKFKITDAKLYFPAVTLSIQYNSKLLKQLNSGFERSINWNKYQTKVSPERQNQYLGFLIDPSFEGVNRTFVLSFENEDDRKVHTGYYLPKVEIKDYNVQIDDQSVQSNIRAYDIIHKITTSQGDDYTAGSLLDYNYLNEHYKMIVVDLTKQQALDADPKVVQ